MTDCCGGVNNITGSNAESSATAGGISGDQIDLGSSVTTSDVDITYTVDDAEWVQGVDYDEAGRPFKLSRTGLGDVVTASSTGQIALPQISGTPSATTFVKVVSGGTLSAADVPGANLSSLSTGVKTGGVLSVASGTTFSITDGTGTVMDDNPLTTGVLTETDVTWTGKTGISVTHIATSLISYVTIDSAGNVQQYTTQPDEEKRRLEIYLGVLVHLDMATLTAVNVEVDYTAFPLSQFRDLADTLGFINASGNGLSDNGANLQFNKGVGTMFKIGSNYNIEHHNPNVLTLNSFVSTSGFQYRLQDGTNTTGHTVIDAANYDLSGTLTAVSPSNRFTIQRIFAFVSQNIILQYGQNLYASLAAAEIALLTEPFVTEPSIAANGLLVGYLIVRGNATDLSDTSQAVFFDAGKFGSATGAVTIASTLQSAYDNSTTNPEILTNTTNGSVNFRRGSAADTDVVVSVQQNSGSDNFTVTGEGTVSARTYSTLPQAESGKLVTVVSNNYHATSNDLGNRTTGTGNVCFGASTGFELTEGLDNVLIGNNAGMNVTTGDNNVAIGEQAIDTVGTGSGNVCIGQTAGTTVSTASFNTCIGHQTDCSNANNQTAIGANATCDAANQVTIGDASVTKIRPLGDGVASLGDATHQIDAAYLKNDLTVSVGDINMTAGDVTVTAGTCDSASFKTGGAAGKLVTTDANDNYHSNSTDMVSLTTGTDNVVIGTAAGIDVTEGSNNIILGTSAGTNITTGGDNISMGTQSLQFVTTGAENIGIGTFAGDTITTASANTCIGFQTDCADANNQTSIGANAICDAANQVTIGDVSVTKIRPTGDGVASLGDATHQLDQVFVKNDITVSAGDINMTAGDVIVTAGDLTVTSGTTSTKTLNATGTQTEHPVTAKTKNAAEGGVTTSESSYYTPGDEEAWKGFDKSNSTRWASASGTYTATTGAYAGAVSTTTDLGTRSGEWVQYQDTTAFSITGYKMLENATNAYPEDWYLCGSTNGSTWIELDSQTGQNVNTEQTYTFSTATDSYNYYRLIVAVSGNQSSLTWTRFQTMTFIETTPGLTVSEGTELAGELKMTSTTNAFLPPTLTTTQRDNLLYTKAGMVVYNTTTNVLNFYNGTAWGAV
jgi:hypothetical protein